MSKPVSTRRQLDLLFDNQIIPLWKELATLLSTAFPGMTPYTTDNIANPSTRFGGEEHIVPQYIADLSDMVIAITIILAHQKTWNGFLYYRVADYMRLWRDRTKSGETIYTRLWRDRSKSPQTITSVFDTLKQQMCVMQKGKKTWKTDALCETKDIFRDIEKATSRLYAMTDSYTMLLTIIDRLLAYADRTPDTLTDKIGGSFIWSECDRIFSQIIRGDNVYGNVRAQTRKTCRKIRSMFSELANKSPFVLTSDDVRSFMKSLSSMVFDDDVTMTMTDMDLCMYVAMFTLSQLSCIMSRDITTLCYWSDYGYHMGDIGCFDVDLARGSDPLVRRPVTFQLHAPGTVGADDMAIPTDVSNQVYNDMMSLMKTFDAVFDMLFYGPGAKPGHALADRTYVSIGEFSAMARQITLIAHATLKTTNLAQQWIERISSGHIPRTAVSLWDIMYDNIIAYLGDESANRTHIASAIDDVKTSIQHTTRHSALVIGEMCFILSFLMDESKAFEQPPDPSADEKALFDDADIDRICDKISHIRLGVGGVAITGSEAMRVHRICDEILSDAVWLFVARPFDAPFDYRAHYSDDVSSATSAAPSSIPGIPLPPRMQPDGSAGNRRLRSVLQSGPGARQGPASNTYLPETPPKKPKHKTEDVNPS
jgi:hypothetical protein